MTEETDDGSVEERENERDNGRRSILHLKKKKREVEEERRDRGEEAGSTVDIQINSRRRKEQEAVGGATVRVTYLE